MNAERPRDGGAPLGILIVYRTRWTTPTQANRFCQKIFGQATSAQGYRYRRKGVLDSIPHWRPARNVIVVHAGDEKKVVKALKEWTAQVDWWSIRLRPRDRQRFSTAPSSF